VKLARPRCSVHGDRAAWAAPGASGRIRRPIERPGAALRAERSAAGSSGQVSPAQDRAERQGRQNVACVTVRSMLEIHDL